MIDVDEKKELTLVEIREQMEQVGETDADAIKDAIVEYLASPLVQASLIGRAYTIGSHSEREQFAEWLTDLMDQVYRYAVVTGHVAGEDDDDDDE